MSKLKRLVFSAAPPTTAAVVGGLAARNAKDVYEHLDKPRWAPPASVFGPVWTALYSLLGVVGWRVSARPRSTAAWLHLAQLGLNASWTPLFFDSRRRRPALVVSALLDAAVVAEMRSLGKQGDATSSLLLLPYLAWSSYATALTAAVSDPPN